MLLHQSDHRLGLWQQAVVEVGAGAGSRVGGGKAVKKKAKQTVCAFAQTMYSTTNVQFEGCGISAVSEILKCEIWCRS